MFVCDDSESNLEAQWPWKNGREMNLPIDWSSQYLSQQYHLCLLKRLQPKNHQTACDLAIVIH